MFAYEIYLFLDINSAGIDTYTCPQSYNKPYDTRDQLK